jgi:predicted nucleic acid-binding protein
LEAPVHQAVVLDTNVLIAASFQPRSSSGQVVSAVRAGRVRMVWDDPTLRETGSLFDRIPPLSRKAVEDLFREENAFRGVVDPTAFPRVPDPDDRKFAALAAAADATLLTLDRALLASATPESGFRARTPAEFLEEMPEASAAEPDPG